LSEGGGKNTLKIIQNLINNKPPRGYNKLVFTIPSSPLKKDKYNSDSLKRISLIYLLNKGISLLFVENIDRVEKINGVY